MKRGFEIVTPFPSHASSFERFRETCGVDFTNNLSISDSPKVSGMDTRSLISHMQNESIKHRGIFLFAMDGDDMIGIYIVNIERTNDKTKGKSSVCIHPEHRRIGVAEHLGMHGRKIAKDIGVSKMYAGVKKTNIASRMLLEKAGYRVVADNGSWLRYELDL